VNPLNNDERRGARRLLFVVNVSWFFISHRLELAKHALNRGYDVHVATRVTSEVDRQTILTAGLTLHEIAIGRGDSGVLQDIKSFIQLLGLYRRISPHIVHLVALKPIVFGGLAARMLRIPRVVIAIPGLGHAFSDAGIFSGLRRWLILTAIGVGSRRPGCIFIFQNIDDQEMFVERGVVKPENTRLIRGAGVDLNKYVPSAEPEGVLQVLLAARLLRTKGVPEFVESARALKKKWPTVRFVLAGAPDEANPASLKSDEIKGWQREGIIEWMGFVEDMVEVLRSSHIVVLPTYYREGVPKVLVEAAACGRPIVTSDIAGCRDIVVDGENGYLVPPRNIPRLLVAIERLIESKDLRRKFGESGRQRVKVGFGQEAVIPATLDIYEDLLTSRAGRVQVERA
jgi:glycosyltransferase involved in cell wall biosynthesis